MAARGWGRDENVVWDEEFIGHEPPRLMLDEHGALAKPAPPLLTTLVLIV